ncbi:F-box domain protein [Aspergillus affinis]|uniref:F-box domain protein n=1 Tax=Aspergillus affinis TaxID=1070780 RepID=UPI0022FF2F43|nr:uncharacterized protein KD926_001440 [Aspergillus affinis]KAI9044210.1 hypothetical protein KD926_001440 [Aspergillus affinis]
MDLDVREILNRFENLDSPARRAAYRHILMQMRLHEWRDVRDHLDHISFHKDILSALPVEVAVQITGYLVRDAAFHRYAGRKTNPAAVGSLDKFSAYARHRTLLERGQPVKKVDCPTYQPLPTTSEVSTLDYCKGHVAWIDQGTTLVVLNLYTHATQQYCTQNRDFFVGMRLSDRIIAAISPRGHCHIWGLHSEESAWFRLPSLQYGFFVASGTSVALSFSDSLSNGGYILHWDLMSHTARTIVVAPYLGYMALNVAAKTLTTVHLESRNQVAWADPAYDSQLRVVRHLLDGSPSGRLPSYTLDLPATEDRRYVKIGSPDEGSRFSDRIGIFSFLATDGQPSASCPIVAVSYDPPTDQVDLHVLNPEHTPFFPLCMTAVDRNILYYLKNDNGKPQIAISNPAATVPHRQSKHMNPQLPREATNRVYSHTTRFALRGDDEYALLIDENGLKMWSFNETND